MNAKGRFFMALAISLSMPMLVSCDHVSEITDSVSDSFDGVKEFMGDTWESVTDGVSGLVGGNSKKSTYEDVDDDSDDWREVSTETTYSEPEENVEVESVRVSELPDYDWLSYREATIDDIEDQPSGTLRTMRNYIYARHGYIFKSPDLKEFFSQYPWYEPQFEDVTPYLNDIEIANVDFIRRYER